MNKREMAKQVAEFMVEEGHIGKLSPVHKPFLLHTMKQLGFISKLESSIEDFMQTVNLFLKA